MRNFLAILFFLSTAVGFAEHADPQPKKAEQPNDSERRSALVEAYREALIEVGARTDDFSAKLRAANEAEWNAAKNIGKGREGLEEARKAYADAFRRYLEFHRALEKHLKAKLGESPGQAAYEIYEFLSRSREEGGDVRSDTPFREEIARLQKESETLKEAMEKPGQAYQGFSRVLKLTRLSFFHKVMGDERAARKAAEEATRILENLRKEDLGHYATQESQERSIREGLGELKRVEALSATSLGEWRNAVRGLLEKR